MTGFRLVYKTLRLNTKLRNEVLAGHIDAVLLQQEFLNQGSSFNNAAIKMDYIRDCINDNEFPDRDDTTWDVFNGLSYDQLEFCELLLE